MTIKKSRTPPHILLSTFLSRRNISQCDLARFLNVSRAVVSFWCGGKQSPGKQYAAQIEIFTLKQVMASSWPRVETTGKSLGAGYLRDVINKRMSSISELSRDCGIPRSTFSNYVTGRIFPSERNLAFINEWLMLSGYEMLLREHFEASK